MEALGRLFNVVPVAAGEAIALKNASAVTFVCTGADTFTITAADTFAGSYATPGNIIDHYYANTVVNGTAAWAKTDQAAGDAVTIAAGAAAITVNGASLPDGNTYVKCTPGATGLVVAIVHDLTVQRDPELLAALVA